MFRLHRLAPTVIVLATAALLAPSAQAMPTVAGGASGGGLTAVDRHAHDTPLANPVSIPTTGQATIAKQDRETGGTGTDWNAVFAGAAGSALIIAMCAGGLSLVRRRTVAA